jgi:aldehyde dehydrogenase (NAD+)
MTTPDHDEIRRIFDKQQANRWRVAQRGASERIERLKRLRDVLWARREDLHRALADDFRKNPGEADLTEVLPTIGEINHTVKHLRAWMRPVRVPGGPLFTGTRSEVRYEAKGVVLVLAPWNYPINLLLNPLVAAIAAGNCVIAKPSSKVPHTARFARQLLAEVFPEDEVAVIEGSAAVSDALLELPFDHIFFTGSPTVGKHVMALAAKNLTPVTLELGGKSPVIVDETADIKTTAERVMWGKFLNAGQTCVAPDYLLLHEAHLPSFLSHARQVLDKRFGPEGERRSSTSFCRLVSVRATRHLVDLIDASVQAGARIEVGGDHDIEDRYIAPTLLTGVTPDSPIMGEEIFGPILPILTFRDLDDPIRLIQSRPKPLALYVFSRDRRNVERVLRQTTSGGSCVNTMIVHLANPELPFGGVGHSGMGSYHGVYGFRNLSHERAVLTQKTPDLVRLFYPPYTVKVRALIAASARFFA